MSMFRLRNIILCLKILKLVFRSRNFFFFFCIFVVIIFCDLHWPNDKIHNYWISKFIDYVTSWAGCAPRGYIPPIHWSLVTINISEKKNWITYIRERFKKIFFYIYNNFVVPNKFESISGDDGSLKAEMPINKAVFNIQ